jgi:RCC1 and BTB domain-containing protein
LGLHDTNERLSPVVNTGLTGFRTRDVFCGGWHTITLSENGDVYSFGKGWQGQLGHGDYSSLVKSVTKVLISPRLIEGLQGIRIRRIFCGREVSAAVSGAVMGFCAFDGWTRSVPLIKLMRADKHGLYTWGEGSDGQLGHNSRDNESVPRLVAFFEGTAGVKEIGMGFAHCVAVTCTTRPVTPSLPQVTASRTHGAATPMANLVRPRHATN